MKSASRRGDRTRLDGFEVKIVKLVREHATSKQWRKWLRAPLEHAAATGDADLFTRLMDAGADGSAGWRGCDGRTLLGAAAHGKSKKITRALLKAGAKDDVNVRFGAKKETALHVAAEHGAEKVSSALLRAGENPLVLDRTRRSPLHLAAYAGHHGVVNILLLKGAHPNARAGAGHTPLHLAAGEGHALCVSKLLVGGADKDSRDWSGYSPIYMAARDNHLGVVEELLAAGAYLDFRGGTDVYPRLCALGIAANRGHVDVTRALLRHGCSVSSSDEFGYTALHYAVEVVDGHHGDSGDAIRVLLEAGADTEAKTTHSFTPLHLASFHRIGSNINIGALVEGGANVNARGALGRTPLHVACSQSCVGAVEALLYWGADEKLSNENEKTAEDVVGEWNGYDDEDDQCIRHMLARAPADRAWRRRGWLVLARSCPAKVKLTQDRRGGGGSINGSTAKIAKASYGRGGRNMEEITGLERLVGRVVALDAEDVFRLVVGFLGGAREGEMTGVIFQHSVNVLS